LYELSGRDPNQFNGKGVDATMFLGLDDGGWQDCGDSSNLVILVHELTHMFQYDQGAMPYTLIGPHDKNGNAIMMVTSMQEQL